MNYNLKISFDEPVYFINKEKGSVVCKLRYCVKDESFNYVKNVFTDHYPNNYYIVTGIAKLKEGDVFDERIGSKIALSRAECLAYQHVKNEYVRFRELLSKAHTSTSEFINKCEKIIAHNKHFVKQF